MIVIIPVSQNHQPLAKITAGSVLKSPDAPDPHQNPAPRSSLPSLTHCKRLIRRQLTHPFHARFPPPHLVQARVEPVHYLLCEADPNRAAAERVRDVGSAAAELAAASAPDAAAAAAAAVPDPPATMAASVAPAAPTPAASPVPAHLAAAAAADSDDDATAAAVSGVARADAAEAAGGGSLAPMRGPR